MKNKRFLVFLLSALMVFSLMGTTFMASADAIEEGYFVKGTGLADETSLLEENGLLKDVDAAESVSNAGSIDERYIKVLKEKPDNTDVSGDSEIDLTSLIEDYKGRSTADEVAVEEKPAASDTGVVTPAAISYYSGTSIPTYTSVTGWPLRDIYTADNGSVMYSYYYYIDDHFGYIHYLMDYYGWQYYDSSESDDGTFAMIFLVNNSQMLTMVADFEYNETIVIVPPAATVAETSVSLDISSRTMIVGNQYTLEATVYPTNATNKSVTWSSSNSSVASVSSDGVVIARAPGSATITARTSNGKTASCYITVKSLVLAYYPNTQIPTFTCITGKSPISNTVDDDIIMYFYTLDIESHTDYEAYLVNKDGWTIIDEEIASDNSYFSASYGKGDAFVVVMANFENNVTGIAFDVPKISVTNVALNKSSTELLVGRSETLTATVAPSNATDKTVTWTSSNPYVASVDAYGVVTAKAEGTAVITATSNSNTSIKATCAVTVKNPIVNVTGLILNKSTAQIMAEDTLALTATVTPSNATDKTVTWTSSNKSVAIVNAQGVVTAVSPGTAVITATSAMNNSITASCTVTVTPRVIRVTSMVLDKKISYLAVGESHTLIPFIAPAKATNLKVTWSSSNSSVASVDSNGTVTAKANGTAVITAVTDDGNFKSSCTVNVVSDSTKGLNVDTVYDEAYNMSNKAVVEVTLPDGDKGNKSPFVNGSPLYYSVQRGMYVGTVDAKSVSGNTVTKTLVISDKPVEFIYGNVDGDYDFDDISEAVDTADLQAFKLFNKGIKKFSGEILLAADVDGDGLADASDLQAIKALVKVKTKLPILR